MKENNNLSLSDLNNSAILRENESLLSLLLKDHTTGKNIKWGTDSYINHGFSFRNDQEIKINLITGWYEGFIRPRVDKDIDIQLERKRNKAEVFTPSWVIKLQVEAALEDMKELSLTEFIQTKWLEITCGEAPYMVNRYDMETGEVIPLKDRSGFIDVKFKKLNQEIEPEKEWLKLAVEIYKASYGYEYQGDSLLLARENLILTFIDNYFYMFGAFPKEKVLLEITKIISRNVFQMDGLTYEVPYSVGGTGDFGTQLSLFDEVEVLKTEIPKFAKIKLWERNKIVEFKRLKERDEIEMKFDVVIGNPPYQENDNDYGKGSAMPLYHIFIESAIALKPEIVSMITPSVWFNGGNGLTEFRERMLDSKHMKLIYNFETPKEVFPNVSLRGGVNYFIWDSDFDNSKEDIIVINQKNKVADKQKRKYTIPGIDMFIPNNQGMTIVEKLLKNNDISSSVNSPLNLSHYVSIRNPFGFVTNFKNHIDFHSTSKNMKTPIKIYASRGTEGYVEDELITRNRELINKVKLVTPFANNIGTDLNDDNLNCMIIGEKSIVTETYLVIGVELINSLNEAKNMKKYLTTKFVRALISLAKANQNGTRKTYRFVPLQDFTEDSDIDWSKSVSEIEQQLYKKYNLNEDEIGFIEINIKEME